MMSDSSDYQLKLVTNKNVTYLTSPKLLEKSIFLAFTTRYSGYSDSPFNSLNLGLHVNDDQKKVLKNRKVVAKSLGFKPRRLTCAEQVHETALGIIKEEDVGAGSMDHSSAIKGTDALITNMANVPLGLFFADCLPVVIVSLKPRLVAIAHAGYKGILNGIVVKLIKELSASVEPKNLLAFLGPSIGPCCYHVDGERIANFYKKFPTLISKTDEQLDLKAIASNQLLRSGVSQDNIVVSSYCTCCNNDLFFSYRRSKQTGRQAAIAYIGG